METSQGIADAIYFGLGAVCVLGLVWWVTDTPPGQGVPRWEQICRWIMLRYTVIEAAQGDKSDDIMDAIFEPERNTEISENSSTMPKDEGNEIFQFPDAFMTLARLIQADKLTESDALRFGIKAPSGAGKRYKEARRRLTIAMNEITPSQYPPLTQAQIDNRRDLDLPIRN